MNQNNTERFLRIIIGGALLIVSSYYNLPSLLSWTFTILGILLVLTGLTGFSPLYFFLKIGAKK